VSTAKTAGKDIVTHWQIIYPTNVTHIVSKGDIFSLKSEIGKIICGPVRKNWDAIRAVFDGYRKILNRNDYPADAPIAEICNSSMDTFLSTKNMKAKPGHPYCYSFASFREVFESLGPDRLSQQKKFQELVDGWEGDILDGRPHVEAFVLHSKRDKFSTKKIKAGAYRSIKGTSFFLHWLMFKYSHHVTLTLETTNENWRIAGVMGTWHTQICSRFSNGSFGIDYTAMEMHVSSDLLEVILREFFKFTCTTSCGRVHCRSYRKCLFCVSKR